MRPGVLVIEKSDKGDNQMEMLDYTFWAIVPALITIILAITTKEVVLSMGVGIGIGCLLMADLNPIDAVVNIIHILVGTVDEAGNFLPGAITSEENALIILLMLLEGAMIGLFIKSGGSAAFARFLLSRINTEKKTLFTTMLFSVAFMFDDYFAMLTNSAITREVSDKNKVSREKYAYVLDSTTFALCQISPISSWVAFICGLVGAGFVTAGVTGINPYQLFLTAVPNNFYAITALIFIALIVGLGLNVGTMAKAQRRTDETGKLCDNEFGGEEDEYASIKIADNGTVWDLVIPIGILIGTIVAFMLMTGGFFTSFSFADAISHMEGIKGMTMGFIVSLVFMVIYMAARHKGTMAELIDAAFIGGKSMAYGIAVLSMGWSLGSIANELGATEFVISVFDGNIAPELIPVVVFVVCAGIAVAMGGDWITYAMMIPIIIPVAVATDASLAMCLTAVIGGGALGANCSPVADATIIAAMGANLSIIDHVKTQAPMAVICGVIAICAYLVEGITGTIFAGYAVVALLIAAAVIILKKKTIQ